MTFTVLAALNITNHYGASASSSDMIFSWNSTVVRFSRHLR